MVMSTILYWYAPFRSKRPLGVRLHSYRGIEPVQNRFKIRVVQKSVPEIEPVRKRTIPFPYEQKKKSSSGPLSGPVGFLRVHASVFHLLSLSV